MRLDGERQLESLVKGVHDAILQLQADTKRRNDTLQHGPKAATQLTTGDSTGVVPSWEGMKDLSTNISSLAKEVKSSASDQMLLSSLWFNYINHRQASVEPAHLETYKWLLDPSSPATFDNWLRYHNGIYWIMGKAGSGKSTLMKFLLNHSRTADSLRKWAGTKEIVTASYFFWNSGRSIQKSQEGLFRSLLYEILSQCPDLVRTVCASKAATVRPFVKEVEPWTQQELWHAIGQLKDQSGVRARFCFFIDGLDEYEGDPNDVVSVLESLRSWPDVKLCVSSRPWNEFKDAFGRRSDPQLALEDLSREDIKIYVRDTLEKNPRFRALKVKDNRSQDLVQEIVQKARGVFLWVILVVKSLLTGLSNADRVGDLQRRLRGFPETLEKYFGHMIASVEPMYREQTAQAFTFALEADEPLSLTMYSFLDEEDLDAVIAAPISSLTTEDILTRQDDMERRLSARCKGLLEVDFCPDRDYEEYSNHHRTAPEGYLYRRLFSEPKVQFLHRTVKDFLHTTDMQNLFAECLKAGFQPKIQFCKAFLAQLKRVDCSVLGSNDKLLMVLLEDLAFYARKIEDEIQVPQVSLLNEVGRCISKKKGLLGWSFGELDFLRYLVQKDLCLYITEILTAENPLTQSDKNILLGSAVIPTSNNSSIIYRAPKMVDILLHYGAEPNGKYIDSTIWGYLLRHVYKKTVSADATLLPIIRSLLSYGANPQERLIIGHKNIAYRGIRRDSESSVHEVGITKTAQELLVTRFGEKQTEEVMKEARKCSELRQKTQKDQVSIPSSSSKWWSSPFWLLRGS